MLNRQKNIIYLLRKAKRPVSRLELVKWCFLLSNETTSRGGSSFYSFLPYSYGPFSFSLYRDIESLENQGLLEGHGEKHWKSITDKHYLSDTIPDEVKKDISGIVNKFKPLHLDDLINYVYESYPHFTVNSTKKKLMRKPKAKLATYTAGYEGMMVDGFLNMLIQKGIHRLIDVRKNPIARRYGFHKSTLDRLCKSLNIEYIHLPQLGIESNHRQDLETFEDYKILLDKYESTTLKKEKKTIVQVASSISEKPSVLVCVEANPRTCHRSRVAKAIFEHTGLPIANLKV